MTIARDILLLPLPVVEPFLICERRPLMANPSLEGDIWGTSRALSTTAESATHICDLRL